MKKPRRELKCWPTSFQAIRNGHKVHEIRREDGVPFRAGQRIRLREWKPRILKEPLSGWQVTLGAGPRGEVGEYTGRYIDIRVRYVTRGPDWGVPHGMVVMSIAVDRQ